jgi:acyl-[acyl carrier protein]--UDP-N-acetylglucosamine O-acyltransferase
MKLLKFPKNCYIGKNNYIESGVKLFENTYVGDNNKIYDGTVIYPNTKIGNNNVILNNNILGEHAIEAKYDFNGKVFKGLEIGNNNFLHINNIIFNGFHRKTVLGDNNKILSSCNIHHDCILNSSIVLYPESTICGLCELMDFSTMGVKSVIQQNAVLGPFSMIGMGTIASHNIFPFYIYFNQKYVRLNNMKIPENLEIYKYKESLEELILDLKNNNCSKEIVKKYDLSKEISKYVYEFLNYITIKKI